MLASYKLVGQKLFGRNVLFSSFLLLAFVMNTAYGQAIVEAPKSKTVPAAAQPKLSEFGLLSARLSEPAGYFGSDNLVSNELSYLHPLGKLKEMNVTGGVYIGVGPDQSYSYIAQIKPKLVLMVDIRRDAQLQHLLYKALFMMSQNRVEYLANLFARPLPKDHKKWGDKTIRDLVEYFDRTPQDPKLVEKLKVDVQKKLLSFGMDLQPRELETIAEIHHAFYEDCLEVRYTIRDRNTGRFFPAFRELLLEKDLDGNYRNYIANEADWQVLKQLHDQNKIVPVTADLSGRKAIREIGTYLKEINEKVSAFYVSNVEFYLWRYNTFDRWVENLTALPIDERSVIIRSYFNYAYYTMPHPQTVDNSFSVQLLQTIGSLIKDQADRGYESYLDMATRHSLELQHRNP
jgi:hypothetical protein